MHAHNLTAVGTGPLQIFVVHEPINPQVLDVDQVVNNTQSVPGPVAFIQVGHTRAWKFITLKTILHFPRRPLFTVLDPAAQARD